MCKTMFDIETVLCGGLMTAFLGNQFPNKSFMLCNVYVFVHVFQVGVVFQEVTLPQKFYSVAASVAVT